jgi:hypothetical protein
MRFPTRLTDLLERYLHDAAPVDGIYLRAPPPPADPPCGPRRRSVSLSEDGWPMGPPGLKKAGSSGGTIKWVNIR